MRQRQTYELEYYYCPACKNKLKFLSHEGKQYLTCSRCQFVFWNNPKPAVSGLFIKNNKVLLIQRKSHLYTGYWSLPGGVIETFEDPAEALKREFFEETNYNIEIHKIINAYLVKYLPNGRYKKPSSTSVDIVYKVDILNFNKLKMGQIFNNEVSKVKMFALTNLPKKIAFGHRKIINNNFNK